MGSKLTALSTPLSLPKLYFMNCCLFIDYPNFLPTSVLKDIWIKKAKLIVYKKNSIKKSQVLKFKRVPKRPGPEITVPPLHGREVLALR